MINKPTLLAMGDGAEPDPEQMQTYQMRLFAWNMQIGYLFFLGNARHDLHTDVALTEFIRKRLVSKSACEESLAYLIGWFSALSNHPEAPTAPIGTPFMQFGHANIILTQGQIFPVGYQAGQEAWANRYVTPEIQTADTLPWICHCGTANRNNCRCQNVSLRPGN